MKKREKKVMAWIDGGIFPFTVMFIKGYSYDEINKRLDKLKGADWKLGLSNDRDLIEEGSCLALKRMVENKGKKLTYSYIILPTFNFTDYDMCKLAHEILHICQFVMPDFLDVEREFESVAYMHTHLMQKCLKLLRE